MKTFFIMKIILIIVSVIIVTLSFPSIKLTHLKASEGYLEKVSYEKPLTKNISDMLREVLKNSLGIFQTLPSLEWA